MNNRLVLWILFALMSVAALALTGCYTQVGVTREDGRDEQVADDNDSDQAVADDQGVDENGYTYDDWDNHPRVGFSYYYPSYYPPTMWPSAMFGSAYSNPWNFGLYYGTGSGYGFGAYYNNPWCYQPGYDPYYGGYGGYGGYGYGGYGYGGYGYGGYGYGGYSPYYGWYNSPYYWYYTAGGKPVQRGGREIGTTRGDSNPLINTDARMPAPGSGGSGDLNLPTGMRSSTGGASTRGSSGVPAPAVDGTTRSEGNTRGVIQRNQGSGSRPSGGTRSSTSRTGNSRVYRQRGGASQASPESSAAPTYTAPSRDGGQQGGTSTRSAQPSSPPPQSAPSSGRGSTPSSGSSRGGNTRGGRPN